MDINALTAHFKLFAENIGACLAGILGNEHRSDIKAHLAQAVDQPHHVEIIGDADIGPYLIRLDRLGADAEDDLRLIFEFAEQLDLAVDIKSGQHPRRMKIVEQLTPKFPPNRSIRSRIRRVCSAI